MLPTPAPRVPPFDAREEALWRDVLRLARAASSVRTVTAATTIVRTDGTVLGNATGGAFAVTLPPAADVPGQQYRVKKMDASANSVTATAAGADLIDGAATYALTVQYQSVTMQSTGTGWVIL